MNRSRKQLRKNLPVGQEDIALNLEICDLIRCKQFNAKEVSASLRKRLRHANPNVQLLTLSLIDVCVKNGGNHFLVEVASRDFMDDLVSILKQPVGMNNQVQNKMLELIQIWAETFKGRPELSYVAQIYGALKAQGYRFPPKVDINAAMIDTKTAPEWTDNDVCMRCRTVFTFTNRKHHCRNCGQIFCQPCSTNKEALPHFGIPDPVRVCTGCYLKLRNASVEPSALSLSEFMASETSKKPAPEAVAPRLTSLQSSTSAAEEMDDDLKRAIELSLQEAKNNTPTKRVTFSQPPVTSTVNPNAEEDADLAAAIAASLQDLQLQGSRPSMYPDPSDYQSSQGWEEPQVDASYQTETPDFNLTERETQNILLFSKLIESLKESHHPVPDASIQNLYNDLGKLVPKLSYNLQDTIRKHQTFLDIQAKLASTIKLYDSLLEQSSTIPSRSNVHNSYEHPLPVFASPLTILTHRLSDMKSHIPIPGYSYAQAPLPESGYAYPPYAHPEAEHPHPQPEANSTYHQIQPASVNYEHGVPNAPSYLGHSPAPHPQHDLQRAPQGIPQGHSDPRYAAPYPQYANVQASNSAWTPAHTVPGAPQYHMHPQHYPGAPVAQAPSPQPVSVPETPLIDL
ncbi:Vacuolar protein-sorting-associated protein 27 [Entomophthora muscae]|uniref:Vacuolar protein-sorting-associated protein 27 n=1 Tax=Entomophthora muscae TaxID=34485 RepID=A0ACC2TNV4_9FUNG|nr:Vacuolar protein-sorting-associated protein 27 [Entomophthora muscae]